MIGYKGGVGGDERRGQVAVGRACFEVGERVKVYPL